MDILYHNYRTNNDAYQKVVDRNRKRRASKFGRGG